MSNFSMKSFDTDAIRGHVDTIATQWSLYASHGSPNISFQQFIKNKTTIKATKKDSYK